MKKVVRLRNKESDEISSYPTLSELWEKNADALGISKPSLYNAMHTGAGFWENKKFVIYYENIDLGCKQWD